MSLKAPTLLCAALLALGCSTRLSPVEGLPDQLARTYSPELRLPIRVCNPEQAQEYEILKRADIFDLVEAPDAPVQLVLQPLQIREVDAAREPQAADTISLGLLFVRLFELATLPVLLPDARVEVTYGFDVLRCGQPTCPQDQSDRYVYRMRVNRKRTLFGLLLPSDAAVLGRLLRLEYRSRNGAPRAESLQTASAGRA